MLSYIKKLLLDTLFPITCFSCGKNNEWICERCLGKVLLKTTQNCPICERVTTPHGKTCFKCKKKNSIDGLLVASSYKNKLISHATHVYKYRFVKDLHIPFGKLLVKALKNQEFPLPDAIIPVPLHKRRLRWRGFNQADLLGGYLGKNLAPGMEIMVLKDSLVRTRYTSPQMKIKNHKARSKNIEGAFKITCDTKKEIKEKSILLIDDIATTGATLFECARILKKKGAREVMGIVIARQEIK